MARESVPAFAGSLTQELGKVKRRFVVDAITGIRRSRSLNLKCMARALNEDVQIHATEKRLSRHLADPDLAATIRRHVLARAARFIGQHTLLVIQLYDLTKPYATRMRLCEGGVLPVADGYRVLDIVATDMSIGRCVPVYSRIWPRQAPDDGNDAGEFLKAVRTVAAATGGKGMFFGDERTACLLARENLTSMSPIADDVDVEYRKKPRSVLSLRRNCRKPFGASAFRYDRHKDLEEHLFLDYGALRVRLPNLSRRLSLLSVESEWFGGGFLVANGMRHRREEIYNSVYTWFEGLEAARAFRNYKAQFDLASFRVLTYERLQSLMAILHAANYYELAVAREGLSFEPRIRFRPHAGDHRRNYLIPKERVPRSQLVRPGPWRY